MNDRVTWDRYFLNIARQVATRATCLRKHVGVVVVRDRSILATGYNGSVRGLSHCLDVGCMMEDGHCVRTVHAEINALAQAGQNGVSLNRAMIYTTASPCWSCFKVLANTGINEIVFEEFYRDERIFEAAKEAGVLLREVSKDTDV